MEDGQGLLNALKQEGWIDGLMDDKYIKKYWFCFSFIGNCLEGNGQVQASTQTGYLKDKITMGMIKDNKERAGVDSNAAVVSVSYLGYMTKEELKG